MAKRRGPALLAIGAAVFLLPGCSSGTGIAAFDRPAEPADAWPAGVEAMEGFDTATSRWLTTADAANFYVIRSEDGQTACLYRLEDEPPLTDWIAGCGGLGGSDVIVEASGQSGKHIALVIDDANVDDLTAAGWTQIHQNVLVKDRRSSR